MNRSIRTIIGIASVFAVTLGAQAAMAQKSGGILKIYHRVRTPEQ